MDRHHVMLPINLKMLSGSACHGGLESIVFFLNHQDCIPRSFVFGHPGNTVITALPFTVCISRTVMIKIFYPRPLDSYFYFFFHKVTFTFYLFSSNEILKFLAGRLWFNHIHKTVFCIISFSNSMINESGNET